MSNLYSEQETQIALYDFIQIVFSARSSGFANRGVYPNTFVINYLNSAFNPAKIAIMERFDWTEAATVTLNDDTHYSVSG